jgi:hypothetical protein
MDFKSIAGRGSSRTALGIMSICLAGIGCKDLTSDPGLPAGTPDPATYYSVDGAIGMRVAAVSQLNTAIPHYLVETGLLADELIDRNTGSTTKVGQTDILDPLDERLLPEGVANSTLDGSASYAYLQTVRGAANVALGALATYDTAAANRASQQLMRGELYAFQGYAELLLADFFCSGVPLSTLDYKQDFTYQPSSNTQQVYTDAKTKLDSALVLSVGNDSVLNMARVLKGRALLALGNYAAAADDVALVPTAFQYRLTVSLTTLSNFISGGSNQSGTVADSEGENGLPFLSSGDPRSAVTVMCSPPDMRCQTHTLTMPAKYFGVVTSAGYAPFVLANGIEARLIEAEAALHANPNTTQWLSILNTLRTTGLVTIPEQSILDTLGVTHCGDSYGTCGAGLGGGGSDPIYGQPASGFPGYSITATTTTAGADQIFLQNGMSVKNYCNVHSWYRPCYSDNNMVVLTLTRPMSVYWNDGTGGVNGLAPLADSGATLTGAAAGAARIAELFRERAYWLFMTGHRQGDLRRLIRQYGGQYAQFRSQQQVYPAGVYTAPGSGRYGNDTNAPIPITESANPNFHGCIDRNA